MKSRYKQRQFDFDLQDIKVLSDRFGFDEHNNFLLKKFGINSQNAKAFFSDGENGLLDPFLMKNMDLAVEKINFAKEKNQKILIFGDYDADGISASAILKLFFDETGIDSFVYLPKRSEGYGLKIETLVRLYKQEKFDLVVTVDCGITAVDEVEFIKKILHADVLVTDHHEPGEKLPNCICVNPKLGYPFRDLSGSGVALKLVQALSCEQIAKSFCDLASIGTIADIMPMESENRAIVKIGCRNVNNLGLKELLIANKIELNKLDCSSMAIKVAPKINAAGRIDEPMIALDLLLAKSEVIAKNKVKRLMESNTERQNLMEKSYQEALDYIQKHNLAQLPAIFVYGENWKHGVLGIVASKLVEKFKVPVGAFMPEGDNIIGSMRTPEGINLHAIVSDVKQHVLRFGGHKMSVGVTVFKDSFNLFYQQFLVKMQEQTIDNVQRFYDAEFLPEYLEDKFIKKVKQFEPIAPNNKIVFYGQFSVKNTVWFGKNKSFLKILTQEGIELKTFADFSHLASALKINCNFECLFSLEYDEFVRKYVGVIIDLNILNSIGFDELYLCNYIDKIDFSVKKDEMECISINSVEFFANEGNCCCVFGSMLEFEKVKEKIVFEDFYLDFFYPNQNLNTVLISPDARVDFSKFKNVICFNVYNKEIEKSVYNENVYCCNFLNQLPSFITGQNIDRDVCIKIFKAIIENNEENIDKYQLYLKCGVFEYSYGTFLCVLKVFEELKIFNIIEKPFTLIYNRGIKVNLADSKLYKMIATE
ncbi:MAG: hypothetical protein E7344_04925 [Clostridiales bacterium]|nr:hypothetical protein [Clostridiales bacterium]